MKATPKITIKNLVAFTKDHKKGTINLAFEGLVGYDITEVTHDSATKQVFISLERIAK